MGRLRILLDLRGSAKGYVELYVAQLTTQPKNKPSITELNFHIPFNPFTNFVIESC